MSDLMNHRDYNIVGFLISKGPSTTRGIFAYLQKYPKLGYSESSKGLEKRLRFLKKAGKIKILKKNPIVWAAKKDLTVDTAIDGFRFYDHMNMLSFNAHLQQEYFYNDIQISKQDNDADQLIKMLVVRYGFFLFSALLTNLKNCVTKKGFNSKLRQTWFKNAVDLVNNEEYVFKHFTAQVLDKHLMEIDFEKLDRKTILKRINELLKTSYDLYPKLGKNLWEHYDIKKHNKSYNKYIKQDEERINQLTI